MARTRPGKTGQSFSTPTLIGGATTGIPPMTGTGSKTQPMRVHIIERGAAGSSAGTRTTATQVAGMIHTIMEVIGMATTRPATMRMSMSTRRVSGSTSTILGKVRTRSTRSISRTIRRLRRRNLMMSPSARAGTRLSLLPTTESLNGTTALPRRILSSSHLG